jgi:hypothetical protein
MVNASQKIKWNWGFSFVQTLVTEETAVVRQNFPVFSKLKKQKGAEESCKLLFHR